MNSHQRLVTQIPLWELWTDRGPLAVTRIRSLAMSDLAVALHAGPLLGPARFVIADIGKPLQWLDSFQKLAFLHDEATGRIVDPSAADVRLADFPGEYCFAVSEWRDDSSAPIYLFERYH
jgi:hypothetical protein